MPAPSLPPQTPVICGPTAGGKSDLAVALALHLRDHHRIPAEIVTADAFQVYRGMDIGTAKPNLAERRGVPHHLIDLRDPGELPAGPFTVENWLRAAESTMAELRARGTLPIVVGGTHLYIKALLDGLFEGPEPDPALRAALAAMDPAARRAELDRVDPAAAARIHPNDTRRTIRALEVFRQTGKPISALQQQWDRPASDPLATCHLPSPYRLFILNWETDLLNPRINQRVKQMLDRGLLAETRALLASGRLRPGTQPAEALGYKQLLRHLAGECDLESAVEQIKIDTRRFAKNQRTWLRRLRLYPRAQAIPMPAADLEATAASIAAVLST